LSAVPEVASSFSTSSSIINLSNALYLVAMGVCPLLFGPIVSLYGRRWVMMLRMHGEVFLLITSIACSRLDHTVHSIFCWDGVVAEPGSLLHLPDVDSTSRDQLLRHRVRRDW
jgi:MFS family permease